ncbi:MAG: hypothetical protein M3268_10580 [Acidobacteriota bacterium]|nr:hypothetical protein [Acidobacteriota bacterium]
MRRLITALLVTVLTFSGAARALASPQDVNLATTPEEEREARELLDEFNKKFVETNDIGPLIKDYFVPDFASRLNQHAETLPLQFIRWEDDAAPPDPEDLQRFYVASTNFFHALFPIYAAAAMKCEEEKDEDEAGSSRAVGDETCNDEHEPRFSKILPPAAAEAMKSDPFFKDLLGSDESGARSDEAAPKKNDSDVQQPKQSTENGAGEGAETQPPQECADGCPKSDGDAFFIKNAEQFRQRTSQFEALSKILREHLAAHPVSFEKKDAAREGAEAEEASEGSGGDDETARFDPERITIFTNARVLEKEFYGYPEGTRLVCANVGALHAELVRADGRLRILTVYLLVED